MRLQLFEPDACLQLFVHYVVQNIPHMTRLTLPDSGTDRRLVFYLAMEEYAAQHLDELLGCCESVGRSCGYSLDRTDLKWCSAMRRLKSVRGAFFIWQVNPTVIFGRNQDMNAEVDVPYCREHGIAMYRRKSGGGCVFADKGNIMISYIRRCTDVSELFSEYLEKLAGFLRSLGLNAEVSGRNDVLVDGRKVSGNAFSLKPDGVGIVHGTLLYDLDFRTMASVLTPSRAKLESKGVRSVEQRVMNLKSALDEKNMDLAALKSAIISYFCTDELELTAAQAGEISEIERGYLEPSFINGHIGASDDRL